MNLFHANDFVVSLPDGLKDKTINVFSLTDEGPSEAGIVVVRDRLRPGESLDELLERQMATLVKRMPLFQLLRREEITLDKHPARLTDCTFHPPDGKMFQRQVAVVSRPTQAVLLISVTCKETLTPKAEAMFNELLANFRLRT